MSRPIERPKSTGRDSFADLTSLMKAKPVYKSRPSAKGEDYPTYFESEHLAYEESIAREIFTEASQANSTVALCNFNRVPLTPPQSRGSLAVPNGPSSASSEETKLPKPLTASELAKAEEVTNFTAGMGYLEDVVARTKDWLVQDQNFATEPTHSEPVVQEDGYLSEYFENPAARDNIPQPENVVPSFLESTMSHAAHLSQHAGDGPVVRLTQPVYTALITRLEGLQKSNQQLRAMVGNARPAFAVNSSVTTDSIYRSAITQVDKLQKENHKLQQEISRLEKLTTDPGAIVRQNQELRWQLEISKTAKSFMSRAIADQDVELQRRQGDLDATFSRLTMAEKNAIHTGRPDLELDYLRSTLTDKQKKLSTAQATLDDTHEKLHALKADNEALNQKNRDLSSQLSYSVHQSNEQTQRIRYLQETLHGKQKLVKSLQEQHAALQAKYLDLQGSHEDLLQQLPKERELEDTKEKLLEKTRETDRFRNQLNELNKALESKNMTIQKLAGTNVRIRGAAHLVKPASTTKLPRTVFSCIECYINNRDCDNGNPCTNCVDISGSCVRWKCSMTHMFKQCPDKPCELVHDANGWLITRDARPQW
ncbi:hypothetical protein BS50DRAFT_635762 [Corynespora cassiicola Philippines]|uniref:Uncharacterized protein n=1 Tax=Corynespora cassiicola Philippines TaxID=1448308 RepID=A0A2T2NHL3_CORCC|nr:hypothetical protein BS50DRAFT_635762 [Corynespora cassiicola Philippines]